MKVTILQTDICWAKPEVNVLNAQQLLDENVGSDLYVLPEMWATGFATKPQGIIEDTDSVALRWMKHAAAAHDCAICGSLAIRTEDGKCRNRHYFVTPQGVLASYDKHHLFTYGGEDKHFVAGERHVVAEWRGVRFLLLTCYDLRFPVWARYGRAGEYDAIIVVANWPESRQQAWRVLTRARAIENQAYLVGVNRVGNDPVCHYAGESVVCDTQGYALTECVSQCVDAKTVELDFSSLEHIRSRFRTLDDRDRG